MAQRLKCLPPMRETWVQSLGREDPLEKEMAIHSSILAWRIPWTEKPSRLQSTGVAESRTRLSDFTLPYVEDGVSKYELTCMIHLIFLVLVLYTGIFI